MEVRRKTVEERGMKISRKKIECFCARRESVIKLQDIEIPKVMLFKYLWSTVQEYGCLDAEVERRKAGWYAWKKVIGILRDRKCKPCKKQISL